MSERIKKQKNTKTNQRLPKTGFFKKTLIQSLASLIICIIMLVSVKVGGKEAKFNVLVRKYLCESTDIKQATSGILNKVNNIIDDEIIPVINNIGAIDD